MYTYVIVNNAWDWLLYSIIILFIKLLIKNCYIIKQRILSVYTTFSSTYLLSQNPLQNCCHLMLIALSTSHLALMTMFDPNFSVHIFFSRVSNCKFFGGRGYLPVSVKLQGLVALELHFLCQSMHTTYFL